MDTRGHSLKGSARGQIRKKEPITSKDRSVTFSFSSSTAEVLLPKRTIPVVSNHDFFVFYSRKRDAEKHIDYKAGRTLNSADVKKAAKKKKSSRGDRWLSAVDPSIQQTNMDSLFMATLSQSVSILRADESSQVGIREKKKKKKKKKKTSIKKRSIKKKGSTTSTPTVFGGDKVETTVIKKQRRRDKKRSTPISNSPPNKTLEKEKKKTTKNEAKAAKKRQKDSKKISSNVVHPPESRWSGSKRVVTFNEPTLPAPKVSSLEVTPSNRRHVKRALKTASEK